MGLYAQFWSFKLKFESIFNETSDKALPKFRCDFLMGLIGTWYKCWVI